MDEVHLRPQPISPDATPWLAFQGQLGVLLLQGFRPRMRARMVGSALTPLCPQRPCEASLEHSGNPRCREGLTGRVGLSAGEGLTFPLRLHIDLRTPPPMEDHLRFEWPSHPPLTHYQRATAPPRPEDAACPPGTFTTETKHVISGPEKNSEESKPGGGGRRLGRQGDQVGAMAS